MNKKHQLNVVQFFILLIAVNCLLLQKGFSQETATQPADEKTTNWALQFKITNNFNLSSFQGSTISLDRALSKNRSFRFGVSLNGKIANFEPDDDRDITNSSLLFGFSSQYIAKLERNNKITPFLGIGPTIQFDYSKVENNPQGSGTTQRITDSWGVGLSGVIGMEYSLNNSISLLAEYGIGLSYSRQKDTTKRKVSVFGENDFDLTTEHEKRTTYNLSSSAVKFGLSIAF